MRIQIARFQGPKQGMTREYAIVLLESDKDDENRFSVHRAYPEGDMDAGSYDLTEQEAWDNFTKRVQKCLTYGPTTWEPEWDGLDPA